MEYLIIVVVAITCLVGGYVLGKINTERRIATDLSQLEHRVASLNWHLQQDPQRALLDHGMTYVLNDMDALIQKTRRDMKIRQTKAEENKRTN